MISADSLPRRESTLVLSRPITGFEITARLDGLRLQSDSLDLTDHESVSSAFANATSLLGKSLPLLIPQILELGLGELETAKCVKIEFDDLFALEEKDIHVFESLAPWAPFVVEVFSIGSLRTSTFRYGYRLYLGTKEIFPKRYGVFVKHQESIYRLDRSTFSLLRAIDEANAMSETEKSSSASLIRFADIKGIGQEIGVQLDSYLQKERVVIPSEIGLGIDQDNQGRISFVPTVPGVPDEAMKRVFLGFDKAQEVYTVDHPEAGVVRVVLGERQKEAVQRMRRVRFLSGIEKARALANPAGVFDGVTDVINLEGFGPRVTGIGQFPFVARPFIASAGVFEDEPQGITSHKIGIECRYSDGRGERVEFNSLDECKDFIFAAKVARDQGIGVVDFKGRTIVIDPDLVRGLEVLQRRFLSEGREKEKPKKDDSIYLLIETNEERLGFEQTEQTTVIQFTPQFTPPNALLNPQVLKTHQRDGIGWLQYNYNLRTIGRRGCLLADDMGLGKTLQVLNFLAWIIEKGDLRENEGNPELPPWNPILVVAPLILLENQTWLTDIDKFFRYNGNVFQPRLVLHGNELKRLRSKEATGRETTIGEPVLDLEKLRQYRLVLTNYETVVNYQFSLARVKWTAVVTDEAQEYKTPSTKISHALKSLDPRFRVACTGTPVETMLRDVWNIFDFLQPGSLLGSAKDFANTYEKPLEGNAVSRDDVLQSLKRTLNYGNPDAHILRREKTELTDLPAKHEHEIQCNITETQRDLHRDFISQAHFGGAQGHHLSVIHDLMYLYQHPDLPIRREGILNFSTREMIDRCPKLQVVLSTLEEIRKKGEKALIFIRYTLTQQVIAKVVGERFGQHVDIINGWTKKTAETRVSSETRRTIIERFQQRPGFNVLVLSPDVAGFGLNLVEANHVIHYGRWWNPAKESQATDRVYRIGQEKDVHVYYPITRDPAGEFRTFDEKLDALVKRRRQLAIDFLMPMAGEEELGAELYEDLVRDASGIGHAEQALTVADIGSLPWEKFEALIAVLESKQGRETILTPKSADQGVDVISRHNNEVRLIQCKHTSFGREIDEEGVAEVLSAFDGYRSRHFAGSGAQLLTMIATNGKITEKIKKTARSLGIKLFGPRELEERLVAYPITFAEVEVLERKRCKTISDVKLALRDWQWTSGATVA